MTTQTELAHRIVRGLIRLVSVTGNHYIQTEAVHEALWNARAFTAPTKAAPNEFLADDACSETALPCWLDSRRRDGSSVTTRRTSVPRSVGGFCPRPRGTE